MWQHLSGLSCPQTMRMERQLKMVRKLSRRSRRVFLEGLRRYQERGVRVLVDGKDAGQEDMERLLMEYEDGSFYMGDYIWEECRVAAAMVRESRAAYTADPKILTDLASTRAVTDQPGPIGAGSLAGKRLKEIHFDRVYYR